MQRKVKKERFEFGLIRSDCIKLVFELNTSLLDLFAFSRHFFDGRLLGTATLH